ncbi:hypothetical protein CEXT_609641 [Caerostris extrusa]|uniref:Uncharacterized protein n=1 Tax=Caerostris extrusa TaxID=172846 RepID=A0AAV4PRD0_CAEEX|nr:hypothetical protein CEXT_609641 [Caerostris extrusa]
MQMENVLKVRSPTTHNGGRTLLKRKLSLMAAHLFPFRHLIFENQKSKRERNCKFRNRKAESMFRVEFNRKALVKYTKRKSFGGTHFPGKLPLVSRNILSGLLPKHEYERVSFRTYFRLN